MVRESNANTACLCAIETGRHEMSSVLKNCFAELLSFLLTKVTPGKNLTIPYPYNELKTLKTWKHPHPGYYWSLAASFNVPTQSWPCFSHTKRSDP